MSSTNDNPTAAPLTIYIRCPVLPNPLPITVPSSSTRVSELKEMFLVALTQSLSQQQQPTAPPIDDGRPNPSPAILNENGAADRSSSSNTPAPPPPPPTQSLSLQDLRREQFRSYLTRNPEPITSRFSGCRLVGSGRELLNEHTLRQEGLENHHQIHALLQLSQETPTRVESTEQRAVSFGSVARQGVQAGRLLVERLLQGHQRPEGSEAVRREDDGRQQQPSATSSALVGSTNRRNESRNNPAAAAPSTRGRREEEDVGDDPDETPPQQQPAAASLNSSREGGAPPRSSSSSSSRREALDDEGTTNPLDQPSETTVSEETALELRRGGHIQTQRLIDDEPNDGRRRPLTTNQQRIVANLNGLLATLSQASGANLASLNAPAATTRGSQQQQRTPAAQPQQGPLNLSFRDIWAAPQYFFFFGVIFGFFIGLPAIIFLGASGAHMKFVLGITVGMFLNLSTAMLSNTISYVPYNIAPT